MLQSLSFKERNIIAYLTSMALVFSAYGWVVCDMVSAGRFDGPDALALLAQCILVLVVATIAVTFIMVIAFNIVLTKVAGDTEDETAYVMDERDRMIELKSLKIAHYLTGTGVVLSMAVLAFGGSAFLVFHLVMFSFAGADVIASLFQFRFYRKGA